MVHTHSELLANVILMRHFLLTNVPWKWNFLPHFLKCPSDHGSVAGNFGWEAWHLDMSIICNATISHFPWGSLAFPIHHVFSDAGPRKHQCPGLNLVANAATSVALCKHVSALPFFCPLNLVEHGHECDPSTERFWILPVHVILNMALDVNGRNTW